MRVIVEGTQVLCERDFHRSLAEQLEFGEYYGWNLAALRDRLSTDVPRPLELVWRNAEDSRRALGDEKFNDICSVLRDVEAQDRDFGFDDSFVFTIE